MPKAAVVGATGYLGGELLRVLSQHPDLELAGAVSQSRPGAALGELYPNLSKFSDVKLVASPDGLDADVAFLAQPPGEAMKVVPGLLERGVRVVDLGPDYRLPDPAEYARVYGKPHADPEHLGGAVYGLPELNRAAIRSTRLVANPGCYPTATLLALAPLWKAHAIVGPVVVDAKSGTSGSGAALSTPTHHPEASNTVWPYGTPEHRHVPEMRSAFLTLTGSAPPLVFVPHLVPLVRGILCSIYPTAAPDADPSSWTTLYRGAYGNDPFVRIGGVPRLPWATGTNRCYLSVQPVGAGTVVFSALDNLGKGGATQAVQNANLLLGLPETAGLQQSGFGV
jgi:N-acetyl-gamma-glutamyl-phosphate reductase